LTLFGGGQALVRDARRATLPAGEAVLRFPNVSNLADGASVQLRALSGGPLAVLEQTFDPGSLVPAKALAAFLGQEIQVRMDGKLVKATLEATDGPMVRIDGKLYLKPPGEVVLPELPTGLEPTPTLRWRLNANGATAFEAVYMTGGLSWTARYDLTMATGATSGRLAAWAAVTNQTTAAFPGAHLVVVAGKLGNPIGIPLFARADMAMGGSAPAPAAPTPTTELDEFHRYDLGKDLTLPADQTRQWPLMAERQVALARTYRFESWGGNDPIPRAARVRITLAPLDVPLAAGRYQLFTEDGTLVGRADAGDSPAGEQVRLDTGSATDVVGERAQTATSMLAPKLREESFAITLRNHKPEAVTVDVIEHPSGDWKVTEQSSPGTRKDASELDFRLAIPAGGSSKLTYTVRVQDP
jgi:hypothetical protein